ncbi:MAG TPA: hypothetical protein VEP67_04745 [Thiobacillaceae bacterium]|nr:hypothetical protein [Thiobacillaceae bacterium]
MEPCLVSFDKCRLLGERAAHPLACPDVRLALSLLLAGPGLRRRRFVPATRPDAPSGVSTVSRLKTLPIRLLIMGVALSLAACSSSSIQRRDGTSTARPFSITNLAKSDVDTITEIHQKQTLDALRRLTEKLYRRNPAEWRKGNCTSAEQAVSEIFAPLDHWNLSSKRTLNWKASIFTAFREDYAGDRIKSLMEGLLTMTMTAYDNKTEFYMLESLDPQKLYNTARNFEVVAWKLSNAKNARGEPMLLSNAVDANGVANLSFEREFGKLVATQDLIALVMEEKTNRAIRTGVIDTATFILFPI